jgi:hypothetical protein
MRQVNINAFGAVLESYDWHEILFGGTIDEKVNTFIGVLNFMVETFFPESISKRHTKDKPFITDKIKSLIVNRTSSKASSIER